MKRSRVKCLSIDKKSSRRGIAWPFSFVFRINVLEFFEKINGGSLKKLKVYCYLTMKITQNAIQQTNTFRVTQTFF